MTQVAADEKDRPARTDWSFVFADPRVAVGKDGEARVTVILAGDEGGRIGPLRLRARRRGCEPSGSAPAGTRSPDRRADSCSRSPRSRQWWQACGASCATTATTGHMRIVFRHRPGDVDPAALRVMWPSLAMQLKTTEPIVWQALLATLGSLLAASFGALAVALAAGVGAWSAGSTRTCRWLGRCRRGPPAPRAALFVAGAGALGGGAATAESPLWPSLAFESAAMPWLAAALDQGLTTVAAIAVGLFLLLSPRSHHRRVDATRRGSREALSSRSSQGLSP